MGGLSRDQKRRAKLKKREERSRKPELLAYTGSKYKKDEFTPIVFRTEVGIHESYVMSERTMTDDVVEQALTDMVGRMRAGALPPLSELDESAPIRAEDDSELVIENIRRNWKLLLDEGLLASRDDMIGVLRTILNSIGTWRSQSMHSQGYLRYLEGFLKKLGVSVRSVTDDSQPLPEPEEDPLLLTGRSWALEGDRAGKAGFAEGFYGLLRRGESERAIHLAQQLLGEARNPSVLAELTRLAFLGHSALENELEPKSIGARPSSLPLPRFS